MNVVALVLWGALLLAGLVAAVVALYVWAWRQQ